MAKAPDPRRVAAERRAEAAKAVKWVIEVDGEEHTFRLPELSALDAGALRREAQMTVGEMVVGAEAYQIDCLAAVVWMARRHAGDGTVRYADVARQLTIDQMVYLRDEDDVEDVEPFADPPGSADSSGS